MKNKNVGASIARPKINNKIKLIIGVAIILLLLVVLILNRNKLFKTQKLASNEYSVKINNTTLDISNLITAEPNTPILGAGMIPIKWDESLETWVITTKDDPEWYNYSTGIPATIMLSNGLYSSELERGKILASEYVGEAALGDPNECGTIFTWVPRLMYKETENGTLVEYLKGNSLVEYDWTTPSCFTYYQKGANKLDLAFTGMWVANTPNTNVQNTEDNTFGLIKNEQVLQFTDEERITVENLYKKLGNVAEERKISELSSGKFRQTIKILNSNTFSPITTQHKISVGEINLEILYPKSNIKMVLDENGNTLSFANGIATREVDEDLEEYTFYVIDSNGNIKKHFLRYIPVGKPDLKGFNPNCTFYVEYDANGNEISEIPIGEKSPKDWYNYENSSWANIVTRNNGDEAYFVWIPRYMYKLDEEKERSEVKFVDTENNYTDMETRKGI